MSAPPAPTAAEVTQWLSENGDLIEAAHERLTLGRLHESLQYQLALQQNLIYLATHADEDPGLEPIRFSRQQQPDGMPDADEPAAEGEGETGEESTLPQAEPGAAPAARGGSGDGSGDLEELLEGTRRRKASRRE